MGLAAATAIAAAVEEVRETETCGFGREEGFYGKSIIGAVSSAPLRGTPLGQQLPLWLLLLIILDRIIHA